jgi:hypothetical protein
LKFKIFNFNQWYFRKIFVHGNFSRTKMDILYCISVLHFFCVFLNWFKTHLPVPLYRSLGRCRCLELSNVLRCCNNNLLILYSQKCIYDGPRQKTIWQQTPSCPLRSRHSPH